MTKGGKRPGAGRRKGSKNRLNKALAKAVAPATERTVKAGDAPLAFLLKVMRDKRNDLQLRIDAAGKALPYLHQRQPQAINVEAVFQTPPPVVLVFGPDSDLPDDL